jgi:acyl carrier protein
MTRDDPSRDRIRAAVVDALVKVAPEADPALLDPRRPLREQLELDSMDFLNFVITIHETLGVDIPEADYAQLASLEQADRYLERRVDEGGTVAP